MNRFTPWCIAACCLLMPATVATAQVAARPHSAVPALQWQFGEGNHAPRVPNQFTPRSVLAPPAPGTEAGPWLAEPREPEALDDFRTRLAQDIRHRGPAVTLMVVGGAAVFTGLLVDEDLITLGGAVAWLYGLYLYVR